MQEYNLVKPKQAVILAGGRGIRLLPLTNSIPKPMICFYDKPFLEYLINLLREQGFLKILLLLGYLPEKIFNYFQDGSRFGVSIEYSISDVDDLTGRRLFLAKDKIDSIFFLLYCDNYLPFNYAKIWRQFEKDNIDAMLTVYGNTDGYTQNNVRVNFDNKIIIYDKSRKEKNLNGVDIGYMTLKHSVLDLIPPDNVSFEKHVFPILISEERLYAYVTHHRYYSIGSHERLYLTKQFFAKKLAILLDRDGVLNKKMPKGQYVCSWNDWVWLDGAKEALRMLNEAGYTIIVITNQAGIARGMLTRAELDSIHETMKQEVSHVGGHIHAIYYCPHHWDDGCFCRKPEPGMLFEAQKDYHLDLSHTYFVGDDERDQMAAEVAGAKWEKVEKTRALYDIVKKIIKEK